MAVAKYLILITLLFLSFVQETNADVCTPLSRSTKYVVKKSETIASVLRTLGLEPVFGPGGNLLKLIEMNNLKNPNLVEPGTEITIPFSCEEQVLGWKLFNREEDRLILLEKADFTSRSNVADTENSTATDPAAKPPEKIEQKTIDIVNQDQPLEPQISTDGAPSEDKVSEALRYRMICEGEWTGSECITRFSAIYLTAIGSYYRYDGTDATTDDTAVMLSKFNPGFGFGWSNYWFENFKTELGFSFQSLSINEEARGRPIDQDKKVLANLYGLAKIETGLMGFSLGISQVDKVFYRFYKENIVIFNDGGVTVNVVPIMQYRAGFSYVLHQEGKFRFDGEIGLTSLSSGKNSGYSVDAGSGFDFSVTVQEDLIKEYLFGTIKYGKSQQNTTIEKQEQTDLSMVFGYAWKLKDW